MHLLHAEVKVSHDAVNIRTGSADDVDAVLAFWKTSTTESPTDNASSLRVLVAHAPESLLLAVEGDEVVGSVIVGWDGWRGAMYRLAVAPTHRRRGIGTRLINEGEHRLAGCGARRLHMIVDADQEAARATWQAAGYEPTNQYRFVKTLG
jgi:ribosomal protein S18 acetylase RimI-like enzyme